MTRGRERRRFWRLEHHDDGTTTRRFTRTPVNVMPGLQEVPERVIDIYDHTGRQWLATTAWLAHESGERRALGVFVTGYAPKFLVLDDGSVYGAMGTEDGTRTIGTRAETVRLRAGRQQVVGLDLLSATHRARPGRPARIHALEC